MTCERFEALPLWQEAITLAEGCEDFILVAKDRITCSKPDQLDRCSLSVSNNIAEDFERETTNDLLNFRYIALTHRPCPRNERWYPLNSLHTARGSAGETLSMLGDFERRPASKDFKPQIAKFKLLAESCSRPAPRLGRFPSKPRHQRPAPSQPAHPRRSRPAKTGRRFPAQNDASIA